MLFCEYCGAKSMRTVSRRRQRGSDDWNRQIAVLRGGIHDLSNQRTKHDDYGISC